MKKILTTLNSGSFELRHRVVIPGPMGGAAASMGPSLAGWARSSMPANFRGGLVVSPPVVLHEIFPTDDTSPGTTVVAGWQDGVRTVHERGGYLFLRLSDIRRPGAGLGYEHCEREGSETILDIDPDGVVNRYREAALQALSAGVDGIEIDATSLTVIDLFLQARANARGSTLGEAIENRLDLLSEVVDGVLTVWERECICVRLSTDLTGETPDGRQALVIALQSLRDQEVGFVHLELSGDGARSPDDVLGHLRRLRVHFPYLLIVSGSLTLETAAMYVESRVADAVGSDRPIYP